MPDSQPRPEVNPEYQDEHRRAQEIIAQRDQRPVSEQFAAHREERTARIRSLFGQGQSVHEVAAALGISSSRLRTYCRMQRIGLPPSRRGASKNPNYELIVSALRDGKLTRKRIASMYDVHPQTVQRIAREQGLLVNRQPKDDAEQSQSA